jgi:hypothetical protein
LEIPIGAGRLMDNLTADYLYTDELWADIRIQGRPPYREAHYERLASEQTGLTPEERRLRKKARAEERQRQKEAQEKEEFERLLQRAIKLRQKLTGQKERGPTTGQRSD